MAGGGTPDAALFTPTRRRKIRLPPTRGSYFGFGRNPSLLDCGRGQSAGCCGSGSDDSSCRSIWFPFGSTGHSSKQHSS